MWNAVPATGLQISAEEAQRVLKDLIFQTWAAGDCESHADTLKMVRRQRLLEQLAKCGLSIQVDPAALMHVQTWRCRRMPDVVDF